MNLMAEKRKSKTVKAQQRVGKGESPYEITSECRRRAGIREDTRMSALKSLSAPTESVNSGGNTASGRPVYGAALFFCRKLFYAVRTMTFGCFHIA